jgi:hypothetical protein
VADDNAGLGAGGTDERLVFTPEAAGDYHLRVSTAVDGGGGYYHLGCLKSEAFNALVPLGVPASRNGSLTTSSPADPLRLPRVFRSFDFRLAPTAAGRIRFSLNSTAFDAYLQIVDAETGRLVVSDDDGGTGLNSRLVFTPLPGVSYIVRVSTAVPGETGAFSMQTTQLPPLPTIGVPQTINGSLTTTDEQDPNYPGTYKDDYRLIGVSPGQTVTVRLTSNQFDAYLFLLDAADESIIDEDDDGGGGTNSELTFTIEEGREYLIRSSSFGPGETGSYTLRTF